MSLSSYGIIFGSQKCLTLHTALHRFVKFLICCILEMEKVNFNDLPWYFDVPLMEICGCLNLTFDLITSSRERVLLIFQSRSPANWDRACCVWYELTLAARRSLGSSLSAPIPSFKGDHYCSVHRVKLRCPKIGGSLHSFCCMFSTYYIMMPFIYPTVH